MTAALFNDSDHQFMAEAIRLAWRGLYTTHPNPRVGCVLVKAGKVIGRGWHQVAGEGHAEVNALREAGPEACGATAYVSLEPCSHHGKTAPCAEALIQAGVVKVISAMEDPNPQVSGRGHQLLQSAGIETACGLMQAQAGRINPGFNKRMRNGLPWVTLKSAMSLDGRTAMASGESQWITCSDSRADVQRLRARVEAIVTGVDTVIADDPSLTVRPQLWPQGLWPADREPIQPLRVIVDSRLRTPHSAAILQQPGETLVVCHQWDDGKVAALEAEGASVVQLPALNQRIDLAALLAELAHWDVNELLVEAGAVLSGGFVAQGLVDEWVCYLAPKLMGSSARPVLGLNIQTMQEAQNLQLTDLRQIGQDIRMTYRWSR
jgi:diaminohydroxyphosphoribosylaminopyrimidine deaminase/5-amino-6-(5-phosphoribosylamino)uracil reductase